MLVSRETIKMSFGYLFECNVTKNQIHRLLFERSRIVIVTDKAVTRRRRERREWGEKERDKKKKDKDIQLSRLIHQSDSHPRHVAIVHFNHDNSLDIVVVNSDTIIRLLFYFDEVMEHLKMKQVTLLVLILYLFRLSLTILTMVILKFFFKFV